MPGESGAGAMLTGASVVASRGSAVGRGAMGLFSLFSLLSLFSLFSLFVSDDELDRWGSVGDDGNGARKLSDRSESGARGMDDGIVVVDEKGSGGGGGGGRLGMGNSWWAICLQG